MTCSTAQIWYTTKACRSVQAYRRPNNLPHLPKAKRHLPTTCFPIINRMITYRQGVVRFTYMLYIWALCMRVSACAHTHTGVCSIQMLITCAFFDRCIGNKTDVMIQLCHLKNVYGKKAEMKAGYAGKRWLSFTLVALSNAHSAVLTQQHPPIPTTIFCMFTRWQPH